MTVLVNTCGLRVGRREPSRRLYGCSVERLANRLRPAEGGPADEPGTPTAVFFVDLAGTYEIELRVTDVGGLTAPSESCPDPVARVFINANPDEDIHIQLVWDTPGDDDQTDASGSDVDLHFLHPRGNDWFRAGGGDYDCYFANPTPVGAWPTRTKTIIGHRRHQRCRAGEYQPLKPREHSEYRVSVPSRCALLSRRNGELRK